MGLQWGRALLAGNHLHRGCRGFSPGYFGIIWVLQPSEGAADLIETSTSIMLSFICSVSWKLQHRKALPKHASWTRPKMLSLSKGKWARRTYFFQGWQTNKYCLEIKEMGHSYLLKLSRNKAYWRQMEDMVSKAAVFFYEVVAALFSWEVFLHPCFRGCCTWFSWNLLEASLTEILLPGMWDRTRRMYFLVLLLLWYTGCFRRAGEKCGFHRWNKMTSSVLLEEVLWQCNSASLSQLTMVIKQKFRNSEVELNTLNEMLVAGQWVKEINGISPKISEQMSRNMQMRGGTVSQHCSWRAWLSIVTCQTWQQWLEPEMYYRHIRQRPVKQTCGWCVLAGQNNC